MAQRRNAGQQYRRYRRAGRALTAGCGALVLATVALAGLLVSVTAAIAGGH